MEKDCYYCTPNFCRYEDHNIDWPTELLESYLTSSRHVQLINVAFTHWNTQYINKIIHPENETVQLLIDWNAFIVKRVLTRIYKKRPVALLWAIEMQTKLKYRIRAGVTSFRRKKFKNVGKLLPFLWYFVAILSSHYIILYIFSGSKTQNR